MRRTATSTNPGRDVGSIRLDLLGGSYSLLVGLTTALEYVRPLDWRSPRPGRHIDFGSLLLVVSYLGQLYAPLKTIGRKATSLQTHWLV